MARWDQTSQGQDLNSKWEYMRGVYNTTLPTHSASLNILISRPITG